MLGLISLKGSLQQGYTRFSGHQQKPDDKKVLQAVLLMQFLRQLDILPRISVPMTLAFCFLLCIKQQSPRAAYHMKTFAKGKETTQ